MTSHRTVDPSAPSTSGARQTVAASFAALIFFMLLLPLVHVSIGGATNSRLLIQMIRTDGSFNVFALLLLLVPLAGLAAEMLAPRKWRGAGVIMAIVGIVLIPLAIYTTSRTLQGELGNMASISPGLGAYVLVLGYIILAIVTGTAAVRERRHHHGT